MSTQLIREKNSHYADTNIFISYMCGFLVKNAHRFKDRPPQGVWQEISSFPNLQIQYTDQLLSSRLTMVIVDNELSLVVEEKKYEDPVGIATYSNSESTVLSYASIFENLWIQSEIKQ
jgi:hypothetical protein